MSSGMTPAERTMRARLGAHASWAKTEDRTARTAAARRAAETRFERLVDPEGTLDPAERHRRAEHARQAHMQRLALASARARRLRAQVGRTKSESPVEYGKPDVTHVVPLDDRDAGDGDLSDRVGGRA